MPTSDTSEKIEKLLKVVSPNHPYFTEQEAANELFDEAILE